MTAREKCERLNTFLTLLHGETRCEREKDHDGPHIASVEGCHASWPNEKDAAGEKELSRG